MADRPQHPVLTFAARALALGLCSGLLAAPAAAQSERERAQMAQMQRQLQKLQQDNAQLNSQLAQARAQATQLDQLKAQSQSAQAEASRLRSSAAAGAQQSRRLTQSMQAKDEQIAQLQTELGTLKAEMTKRDGAAQTAAAEAQRSLAQLRAEGDNERNVLAARLKLTSQRAQSCEAQHGKAMQVADEMAGAFERERAGLCEPFTGLRRVGQENRLQTWRDRLDAARAISDTPPASAAAPAR
jgi:chromosome segregation ATPase